MVLNIKNNIKLEGWIVSARKRMKLSLVSGMNENVHKNKGGGVSAPEKRGSQSNPIRPRPESINTVMQMLFAKGW